VAVTAASTRPRSARQRGNRRHRRTAGRRRRSPSPHNSVKIVLFLRGSSCRQQDEMFPNDETSANLPPTIASPAVATHGNGQVAHGPIGYGFWIWSLPEFEIILFNRSAHLALLATSALAKWKRKREGASAPELAGTKYRLHGGPIAHAHAHDSPSACSALKRAAGQGLTVVLWTQSLLR
jgi:hypothetical protein